MHAELNLLQNKYMYTKLIPEIHKNNIIIPGLEINERIRSQFCDRIPKFSCYII